MTASISADELIFARGYDYYNDFPKKPIKGIVGCFSTDRGPNWSLFVVIDFDEKTNMMTIIRPKIRVGKYDQVSIDAKKYDTYKST